MKHILTLTITIFLFSCNNSGQNEGNKMQNSTADNAKQDTGSLLKSGTTRMPEEGKVIQVSKSGVKAVDFSIEFLNENKNLDKNDLTLKEGSNKFAKELKEKDKSDLFNDYPMEFDEVKEFQKGKFAAHFASAAQHGGAQISNAINFDIIGLVDHDKALTLQEKKEYHLKGKFIKYLGKDFQNYTDGLVYSYTVGIDRAAGIGIPELNMGIMLFKIDSLKEVK